MAVLPERGPLAPLLEQSRVEVVTRPLAVLRRGLLSPGGAAATAVRLARDRAALGDIARSRGAAIVHSNTSVVLGGGPAARRAGARHVMHVREIYTDAAGRAGRLLWPLMRRRILGADAVACISDAVAAQFGEAQNVSVLRDGLPRTPAPAERAGARRALGLPEDRFVVGLVGRVSDWKGQDVLARALAHPPLVEIGAVGVVAGDAFPGKEAHERELDDLRRELGLGERLKLSGFVEDVGTVLGAVDAVAVPSTRPEPLGLVAVEAASAGLPVVAAAHGGVTEVVRDGSTGLLVAPGDVPGLASALRRLADDAGLRRRLGSAGAEDANARFSRERMLDEVHALYERLLRR